MINETLIARAKKLIDRAPDLHGFRSGDVAELNALTGSILEKTACRGCPGEQMQFYLELRDFINQLSLTPKNLNQMGSFRVKEGAVVHDMPTGRVFSNKNIDTQEDEVLEMLARNPKAIRQFTDYPKDWEAKVTDWKKRQEAKKKKDADSKAKIENGGGPNAGAGNPKDETGSKSTGSKSKSTGTGSKTSTQKPAAPKPPKGNGKTAGSKPEVTTGSGTDVQDGGTDAQE